MVVGIINEEYKYYSEKIERCYKCIRDTEENINSLLDEKEVANLLLNAAKNAGNQTQKIAEEKKIDLINKNIVQKKSLIIEVKVKAEELTTLVNQKVQTVSQNPEIKQQLKETIGKNYDRKVNTLEDEKHKIESLLKASQENPLFKKALLDNIVQRKRIKYLSNELKKYDPKTQMDSINRVKEQMVTVQQGFEKSQVMIASYTRSKNIDFLETDMDYIANKGLRRNQKGEIDFEKIFTAQLNEVNRGIKVFKEAKNSLDVDEKRFIKEKATFYEDDNKEVKETAKNSLDNIVDNVINSQPVFQNANKVVDKPKYYQSFDKNRNEQENQPNVQSQENKSLIPETKMGFFKRTLYNIKKWLKDRKESKKQAKQVNVEKQNDIKQENENKDNRILNQPVEVPKMHVNNKNIQEELENKDVLIPKNIDFKKAELEDKAKENSIEIQNEDRIKVENDFQNQNGAFNELGYNNTKGNDLKYDIIMDIADKKYQYHVEQAKKKVDIDEEER